MHNKTKVFRTSEWSSGIPILNWRGFQAYLFFNENRQSMLSLKFLTACLVMMHGTREWSVLVLSMSGMDGWPWLYSAVRSNWKSINDSKSFTYTQSALGELTNSNTYGTQFSWFPGHDTTGVVVEECWTHDSEEQIQLEVASGHHAVQMMSPRFCSLKVKLLLASHWSQHSRCDRTSSIIFYH